MIHYRSCIVSAKHWQWYFTHHSQCFLSLPDSLDLWGLLWQLWRRMQRYSRHDALPALLDGTDADWLHIMRSGRHYCANGTDGCIDAVGRSAQVAV
jgi:hypothetical protein